MAGPEITVNDAVQGLRSGEQVELLNAIDKLRRENISADISVPQIVVCGDQSSGKSSVLEAIARVRFPRGSRLTTRFPIEVVLRNAATESTKVRLHPSPERHDSAQQELIRSFKPKADASNIEQFEQVVQQAKDHLESVGRNGEFWGDRLIAEISGPDQPHLTLVDLPGLIHNAASNSKADDPATIKKITRQYLENPRTVVLAVVNALNDQANQQILSLVEQTGTARSRTMGIITKPDLVPKQSDDEAAVIDMARNNEVHMGLGWHVLKNVGHHEDLDRRDRRDELESLFFSAGAWSSIDDENVGISNLRKKLSKSLLSSIKRDLPKLLEEMQEKLSRCTKSLDQLGEGRESTSQQRGYFSKILLQLKSLVEAGLDGKYSKSDSEFFDGAKEKQLRDVINVELRDFAATMRERGKTLEIYSTPTERETQFSEFPFGLQLSFTQHQATESLAQQPQAIHLHRYCKALSEHMRGRQGKHLQIHAAPFVPDIFRQQSVFWERITRRYVDRCHSQALEFMEMAVMHVAGKHTGDKLVQLHIVPAFENKAELLTEKISDLLWPYLRSHPITYNASFDRRTVKANGFKYSEKIRELSDDSNTPPDLILAAEAVDQAETYYEIARNIFIDNVATLAIERWLLDDLPSLIPSQTVWTLSNEDIEKIAAEPFEFREKRRRLTQQVAALQEAMRICRRHARHRITDGRVPDEPAIVTNGRTSESFSRTQTQPKQEKRAPSASNGFGPFGGQRSPNGAQEASSTSTGDFADPLFYGTNHTGAFLGSLSGNTPATPRPTSGGKERSSTPTISFGGSSPNGVDHARSPGGSAPQPTAESRFGGQRNASSFNFLSSTNTTKQGSSLFRSGARREEGGESP